MHTFMLCGDTSHIKTVLDNRLPAPSRNDFRKHNR